MLYSLANVKLTVSRNSTKFVIPTFCKCCLTALLDREVEGKNVFCHFRPENPLDKLNNLVPTSLPRCYGDQSIGVHCSLFTVHCSLFTVHCSCKSQERNVYTEKAKCEFCNVEYSTTWSKYSNSRNKDACRRYSRHANVTKRRDVKVVITFCLSVGQHSV